MADLAVVIEKLRRAFRGGHAAAPSCRELRVLVPWVDEHQDGIRELTEEEAGEAQPGKVSGGKSHDFRDLGAGGAENGEAGCRSGPAASAS